LSYFNPSICLLKNVRAHRIDFFDRHHIFIQKNLSNKSVSAVLGVLFDLKGQCLDEGVRSDKALLHGNDRKELLVAFYEAVKSCSHVKSELLIVYFRFTVHDTDPAIPDPYDAAYLVDF